MSAFLVSHSILRSVELTTGIDVHKLMDLNARAITQRYGEEEDTTNWKREVLSTAFQPPKDDTQSKKDLRCFLYQCSEGTVPEDALFKTLERAYERMPQDPVGYGAAAVWGR